MQVHRWRRGESDRELSKGEHSELARLRKENAELAMERVHGSGEPRHTAPEGNAVYCA
jgi:hypothetical protein